MDYQNQILQGYDILREELKSLYNRVELRQILIRLYIEKIRFFIIHREHVLVIHCIEKIQQINKNSVPAIVRIALRINKIYPDHTGFHMLRKWIWIKKSLSLFKM